MADLINILRCTYMGPGEGVGDEVLIVSDLSKVPYSRIMMNGNDITSEVENGGGWAQVSGSYFTVDFYLTGDTIGARAFEYLGYESQKLIGVNVPSIVKKLGSYTFANNAYLTDIILNEGLEDIGYNEPGEEYTGRTFEGITRADVTVPSTVRHIGQNSFYNWNEFQYILFTRETPPTIDDDGQGTLGQGAAKILVPPGTTNAYKAAVLGMYWPYIEEYDPNVTNKSIANAYAGEDGVMKIYLGANLIYSYATCSQIGMCGDVPNCYPCTCADEGRCGDYPNCHECTCEETYDEGTEDYCNCVGGFWDGEECHTDWNCTDNWEDMGYSSEYDCNCTRYGDCHSCDEYGECGDYPNCYECEPEEPCAGMEQDIADCEARGGSWDYVNCGCNEPEDPCEGYEEGSQEKCECEGRYWYADECHDEPEPEPEPTCEEQGLCDDGEGNCYECEEEGCNGDPECECNEQGGTWDGEECQFE